MTRPRLHWWRRRPEPEQQPEEPSPHIWTRADLLRIALEKQAQQAEQEPPGVAYFEDFIHPRRRWR